MCLLSVSQQLLGAQSRGTKTNISEHSNECTNLPARLHNALCKSIGTDLANPVELDLVCKSRVYFDNVTLASHNVTLTLQKPRQYSSKFDCSETNGYNIPQVAIK